MKTQVTILIILFAVSIPANAAFMAMPLGTTPPPSTLGMNTMTPFGADLRPVYDLVTSVSSPLGGAVGFNTEMDHRTLGNGWLTWSNGYTGDVYYTYQQSVTLTLPFGTRAFYFYAEPQQMSAFTTTASSPGFFSNIIQNVDGLGGACGFAFFINFDPGTISSINISCDDPAGFAIGEFGITQIPEPTTICLLGIGALSLIRRKK